MQFKIAGKIIEREEICREYPRLYVVAFDALSGENLGTTATTEKTGEFEITYEWESPHDVLLSVTVEESATNVVARTQVIDEMVSASEWTLDKEKKAYTAYKDLYITCCCILWAQRGFFTIIGKVVDKTTGLPLPGRKVEAQDWDPSGAHDFLGMDTTDSNGRFIIRVPIAQFIGEESPGTGWRPDLRFRVTTIDANGNEAECLGFDDDKIRWNWPNCKLVTIPVSCCMPIIETVAGWDATYDPVAKKGIDSEGYAQGPNAFGDFAFSGYFGGPGVSEVHNAPFGGVVKICGKAYCTGADRYKYSIAKWPNDTTPPNPSDFKPLKESWTIAVKKSLECKIIGTPPFDGIICKWKKEQITQTPDGDFYEILPTDICDLYIPWNTMAVEDGKYSVMLTVKSTVSGHIFHSAPVVVRIDNCLPIAKISLDVAKPCDDIYVGMQVTGKILAKDKGPSDTPPCVKAHFHRYWLVFEGNAASGTILDHHVAGAADEGVTVQAFSWDTDNLTPCGYRLVLRVWDRSIIDGIPSGPYYGNCAGDQIYFCLRQKSA